MSKKKNDNVQSFNEIKNVKNTKTASKDVANNTGKTNKKEIKNKEFKNTMDKNEEEIYIENKDLKEKETTVTTDVVNENKANKNRIDENKVSEDKACKNDVDENNVNKSTVNESKVSEDKACENNVDENNVDKIAVNESKVDEDKACKNNVDENNVNKVAVNESKVDENEATNDKKEGNNESKVNNEDKENDGKEQRKSHKNFFIISIVCCIILLLCLVFSMIFAFLNSYSSTIIHGVHINGIDVSGLTKEDAKAKLSSIFEDILEKPITLTHNEYNTTIFPSQFDVSCSIDEIVDTAYQEGRDKNIFISNYEILETLFLGNNMSLDFNYSEETLDSLITEMETNFSDRFIDSSYYVEDNSLVLSKGQNGVVIEKEKLKNNLLFAIMNFNASIDCIEIPTIYQEVSSLDISKIYQEVCRAPQDAYYTTNPFVIYPHVDGIDFAISQEEAQRLLDESQDDCKIPLKVLSPNVTTNQIGTEAFPDLLGTYYTTFSTANVNRSTNIRLAANKINGMVMMPDEVFSYNQVVGKRTAAAGFKSAAVYVGGEVTTGIGGGICQVSSTLYNSVLLANLEIVERQNHGFNTGYVPVGRDATVSWGGPDFKFKNTRDYPIKIIVTVSGGRITTQIFGLKSDNEYDVEIQSYVTQYIKYKTIEQPDASLQKGKTKVIQNGSNGCKSVAYRILKQNGEVVSKTLLSQDTYNPHNKIVAVGTKED